MQLYLPTSREDGRRRVEFFDLLTALFAGPLAFFLRDPAILNDDRFYGAIWYCAISAIAGVLMLLAFDLGRGLARYASLRDAFAIAQMSLAAVALTSAGIFTFTRLNDVPRSIPVIHFMILTSLLLAGRAWAIMRRERRYRRRSRTVANPEQVLVIGANRLAGFYLRMVDTLSRGRTNIVALLDANPRYVGRSLYGHHVLAPPGDLERVVTEYAVHGVKIDRVIIAANRGDDARWGAIEDCCARRGLRLSFLPDDLGISLDLPEARVDMAAGLSTPAPSGYFRLKRGCELVFALVLLAFLAPVLCLLVIVVFLDVGWPVVFWQKRVGYLGRPLLVYKLRTLHAPFDRSGRFVEEKDRVSRLGNLLRRLRLDELPQLGNIIAGNMSFVGTRPLLPEDQPETSKKRLWVLPGITGWAQIHGGKLVSQNDKGVLDDWYVENATLGLDIRIIWRTLATVILGDRHMEGARPGADLDEVGTIGADAKASTNGSA